MIDHSLREIYKMADDYDSQCARRKPKAKNHILKVSKKGMDSKYLFGGGILIACAIGLLVYWGTRKNKKSRV